MNPTFLMAGQAVGAAPANAASPAASVVEVAPLVDRTAVSPWAGLVSTGLSLLFVLALAWLVLRWLRRSQVGGSSAEGPRVLRAVGLGPRERLVVVQHRDAEYLLGVTANSINVIERRDAGAAQAAPPASSQETAG